MSRASRGTRFSLLLLEDSEVLLFDLAVNYHFMLDAEVDSALHPLNSFPQRLVTRPPHAAVRGRVKLATRSISFDSDDWRDPIVRIPLVAVDYARPTRDSSRSRDGDADASSISLMAQLVNASDVDGSGRALLARASTLLHAQAGEEEEDNSVLVAASAVVFQRELGVDHPYVNVRARGRHIFTPLYTSVSALLNDINSLLRITASVNAPTRDTLLRDLVQQREARVPFDITLLEHGAVEETLLDTAAEAIYTVARQPGRLRISCHNVYFMPIHGESAPAADRIPVQHISAIRSLRYGCRDAALEISFAARVVADSNRNSASLMLAFSSQQVRKRALHVLHSVISHPIETYSRHELEAVRNKWRAGSMSNFEYLMYLNLAAGRSFNDLSQYPVFPWILQDYTSTHLDLSSASTFRDLSKPIGALNEERLESFLQRYSEMPPPAFIYGTHYSTPAYVINYLVRAAPAAMLRLQNGRFDTPDRLFHNIASAWDSVLHNRGDVKELIPEFYVLSFADDSSSGIVPSTAVPGEFLDNVLGLDLGTRQDGIRVDDVELPPWANGSSLIFVRKMREALESDHASRHLHTWIDLIFGVMSRNADAFNVFYTDVALPQSIESDAEQKLDDEEMNQIQTIYLEFGRTPEKLFKHPHPPRFGEYIIPDFNTLSLNNRTVQINESLRDPNVGEQFDDTESVMNFPLETKSSNDPELMSSISEGTNITQKSGKLRQRSRSKVKSETIPSRNTVLSLLNGVPKSEGDESVRIVPSSSLTFIIDNDEKSVVPTETLILDMCMVDDNSTNESLTVETSVEICTVWDNEYLKVHSESKALRSKFISGVCSVRYVKDGIVAYGSRDGSIGLYYIDSARDQLVQERAHEGEVCVIKFVPKAMALVSGSQDGSVKVWRFEQTGHRSGRLQFIQEMDAESCVGDLIATYQEDKDDLVLIAVWTLDKSILVWELNMDSAQACVEPIWRQDQVETTASHKPTRRRKGVITWLHQNTKRRPNLVSSQVEQQSLRIWDIEQTDMLSAEVFEPSGTGCVCASGKRTVLLGGSKGRINEFDCTGLCVGRVSIGQVDMVNLYVCHKQHCIVVWDCNDQVCRLNFEHS